MCSACNHDEPNAGSPSGTASDVGDALPVLPGTCRLRFDHGAGTTFVQIAGELDRHSGATLTSLLEAGAAPGSPVTLDLRRVTFIDAAAYRMLHEIADREGAPVTILASSPVIDRMATLVGEPRGAACWPPSKAS